MAAVRQVLTTCIIRQEAAYLPNTHDDGIWYFHQPSVENSVQIESSSGMCPCLIEMEGESGPLAATFASSEEIAAVIIASLTAAQHKHTEAQDASG